MFGDGYMAYIPFNQIVDALHELNANQIELLLRIILDSKQTDKSQIRTKLTNIEEIREARFHDGLICPHCAAHDSITRTILKNGQNT
jgi:hypothetical protein